MNFILLTKNETFLIGWVARLLGMIMNGIFYVIDWIGLPNVGLAIILFTVVVNLLMMPLTVKQQKFSKLSAKMDPELQAIRAKYKNRKDNDSMMAQNQEIQAVYAKYGVSASGSCVQLLIQMPILFALYKVIYSMPAYVTKIGETFRELAKAIIGSTEGVEFLKNSGVESISNTVAIYGKAMENGNLENGVIDVLNKLSSTDLATVAAHYGLNDLEYKGQLILSNGATRGLIDTYNNFLGLNMGDSPSALIKGAFAGETVQIGIVIGAIMIPILSMVTQWINTKLMPQAKSSGDKNSQENSMAQSMKTMNKIMPIMSAWFCFTLPSGMGLYWIAGSVIRSIQQVLINRHIDKMNFDDIIKKNSVKSAKKLEKMKAAQERMNTYAAMNTRGIQNKANIASGANEEKVKESEKKAASADNSQTVKAGSMMAKANLVREYNEKNNKGNE